MACVLAAKRMSRNSASLNMAGHEQYDGRQRNLTASAVCRMFIPLGISCHRVGSLFFLMIGLHNIFQTGHLVIYHHNLKDRMESVECLLMLYCLYDGVPWLYNHLHAILILLVREI
jgi:hypothetical protein